MVSSCNAGVKPKPSGYQRIVVVLFLCSGLMVNSVLGEGGIRTFECVIEKTCDASGNCETGDMNGITLLMEPDNLNADGSGSYMLNYDNGRFAMEALSNAGPFVWRRDGTRHTLLASSEEQFLWHQVFIGSSPEATIRFMQCRVIQ